MGAGTWSEQAHLFASNPGEFSYFGAALALQGDTLVATAIGEASAATGIDGDETDTSATGAGAAYVFTRSGSSWTQRTYIKASNTAANDAFGCSIALDGDTLAVGAEHEDGGSTGVNGDESTNSKRDSGAVYVFTRSGDTWSQQAYLKASNSDGTDFFGVSVALSGDVLAVGAHLEDSGANGINGDQSNNDEPDTGAVYIFVRSGSTWTQEAYIKAAASDAADKFGRTIAMSGNLLAVAAPGESSRATGVNGDQYNNELGESGAAYLFRRTGTTWSQIAYVKATNTQQLDAFGSSIALYGTTLAVGAVAEDSNATGINGDQTNEGASASGAVYLYE